MSRPSSGPPARQTLRRQSLFRARTCAAVAIAHGLRHCVALVHLLADWDAWSQARGKLPYPSQERLARELGVTVRTIGEQIRDLERIRIIDVYRSPARPTGAGGHWTRQTNRYVLCDRRWQGFRASPIRRRHRRKPQVAPTGSQLPVTLFHGLEPGRAVDDPPPGRPRDQPSDESSGESVSRKRKNRPTGPSISESGLHLGRITVSPDVLDAVLFDVDEPDPAAPPPWITDGITQSEWIRRCRTGRI